MWSLSPRFSAVLVSASLLFHVTLFAQVKVLAPHRAVPPTVIKRVPNPRPATTRSVVGGLWMIDANLKSSIYLHNNNEIAPITTTPILYLSNGKTLTLPDVVLAPAGTTVLNVNDALRDQGISSWATLSGYVEVQYTSQYDPLCVIVNSIDVIHSLIFTSGLRASLPLPAAVKKVASGLQVMEGMWWKEEANVNGFVALSNTTTQPLKGTLQVSGSKGEILGEHSVLISPHGTKMLRLVELQSITDRQGGLRVSYDGPSDALIVNGHLQDADSGYSATIPFTHTPSLSEVSATTSFAELGLMNGAADPMLLFPAGTVLPLFPWCEICPSTRLRSSRSFTGWRRASRGQPLWIALYCDRRRRRLWTCRLYWQEEGWHRSTAASI